VTGPTGGVRNSDRLATPAVVITLVVIGGLLVALTIAAVTYLTARGLDPEPMFKLVGIAVTGLSSLGAFLLQLVNRATIAKTEQAAGLANRAVQQQTGHLEELAASVYGLADALPRRDIRHGGDQTFIARGTAPAPPGR
jgi:hypothetical protein